MLHITKVRIFTFSELLRENQRGGGGGGDLKVPPPRLELIDGVAETVKYEIKK